MIFSITFNSCCHYFVALVLVSFILSCTSCKNSINDVDKLSIAKQYYQALNDSNAEDIAAIIADSMVIRESEYDYEETFPKKSYIEWLKWDAVFEPSYEILDIKNEEGIVRAKISKLDKRIQFLHEVPIVSQEIIHFNADKITKVEKTYIVFNEQVFLQNRDSLVNWIAENHPNLDGFLYDQTERGGLKYLEAISNYKNKK